MKELVPVLHAAPARNHIEWQGQHLGFSTCEHCQETVAYNLEDSNPLWFHTKSGRQLCDTQPTLGL